MEWAEVFFTYDEIEAKIVTDILEAEEIEVSVKSGRISPFPANVCKMGEISLLVRQKDLETARKILEIMRETG